MSEATRSGARILTLLMVASTAALGLALVVEHHLGYAPCALCELARLPHIAVLVVGTIALSRGWIRAGLALCLLAYALAFAISLQHVGVEHGWLPLPSACTIPDGIADRASMSQALLAQTAPTCDQPGPRWFGVSMAQWHLVVALGLAVIASVGLSRFAPQS